MGQYHNLRQQPERQTSRHRQQGAVELAINQSDAICCWRTATQQRQQEQQHQQQQQLCHYCWQQHLPTIPIINTWAQQQQRQQQQEQQQKQPQLQQQQQQQPCCWLRRQQQLIALLLQHRQQVLMFKLLAKAFQPLWTTINCNCRLIMPLTLAIWMALTLKTTAHQFHPPASGLLRDCYACRRYKSSRNSWSRRQRGLAAIPWTTSKHQPIQVSWPFSHRNGHIL